MTLERFADEVSSNSPAPGGGSVAALAGSLGAALAAMVANLTVGKAGYESAWAPLSTLAERAQSLKTALLAAVDDDTKAFDSVLAAMRLPSLPRSSSVRGRQRSHLPTRRRRLFRLQRRDCACKRWNWQNRRPPAGTGIRSLMRAWARCSPKPGSMRR